MRKRLSALAYLFCLAGCATNLEDDPAGNSIGGTLHYAADQSLADSYGNLGLAVFAQPLLADEATGQPGSTVAPSPIGVLLTQLKAEELEEARGDGYRYQLRSLNLGDSDGAPLEAWPFVVIASIVDFNEFTTATASTYFQTSPFGAYPSVCALSVPTFQLPMSVQAMILSAVGGEQAVATAVISAVTMRVIPMMAADQRIGSPTVVVQRDTPTTDISFELHDAAQAPETVVPCKVAIDEIVTREVGISLSRLSAGLPP